jgi:predicted ATPase/DNA-binding CsgD family transcriptional regulator
MGATGIHGNLPSDASPFLGRDSLLEKARRLLSHVRLLTITGPGGVGKTRLALRVLRQVKADGAWIIDIKALAEQSDYTPGSLYSHLALVMGIHHNQTARLETLLGFLGRRQVVLMLDNCEYLVDETRAFLEALLVAAPEGTRILATSREVLGVEGEHQLIVPPLSHADAVEAFIQYATAADTDLEREALSKDPDIADLCRKTDGIPLAIRLAAGRIPALSVRELLTHFDVLTSIEGVVAWSYELCTNDEQRMWRISSVFADEFDLATVAAVACSAGIERSQVVDLVTGLVRKSVLTVATTSAGVTHYGMLQMIREYGRRQLAGSSDSRHLHDLHCRHFCDFLAQAARTWLSREELNLLDAVHEQLPDILAAFDHCLATGKLALARAIIRDLVRCRAPFLRGFLGLVAQLLRRVVDASLAEVDEPGVGGRRLVDVDPAIAVDVATTAALAGWIAVTVGRSQDAEAYIATAKRLLAQHELGTIPPVLFAEGGLMAIGVGRRVGIGLLVAARDLFSGAEFAGDRHMAFMTGCMGYGTTGEPEVAVAMSEAYLQEAEQAGAPWAISWALWTYALAALHSGDHALASANIVRCLRLQCGDEVVQGARPRDMDDQWGQTWALELRAWIIAAQLPDAAKPRQEARSAAWLLGAAEARRDKIGVRLAGLKPLAERRAFARSMIEAVLDEETAAAETAAGRRDHQDAMYVALGEPIPRKRLTPRNGLTGIEQKVVRLVADGLTSKEIAARLHLAPSTVDTHAKRILHKLGLPNRAALAGWIRESRSSD